MESQYANAADYLHDAEREARIIPGLPSDTMPRPSNRVGILGAGTMGTGITIALLNARIPTLLIDTFPDALEKSVGRIRSYYADAVARGKQTAAEAEQRLANLKTSLRFEDLSTCDLVIEAVFEDMKLKCDVAARLDSTCKPGAIIATNTSTLDVDAIAEATGRATDVVGMHFFSPANIMRLLEVIRGRATAPDVMATVMAFSERIGKVAVISGVCYGFIGNRMSEVYMRENELLQLEGASAAQIDAIVEAPEPLGLAMGPSRMLDMAGIDIGAKTVIEWQKSGQGPHDPNYRVLCRTLFERGRCGQKTGAGYYRYEGRKAIEDPLTAAISAELAAQCGIQRRANIEAKEIFERLYFSMVNEAARILGDGIAARPSDIDVVWTAGFGFPKQRGGPLFYADQIGLPYIVERLEHYGKVCGNAWGYWTVAPVLAELTSKGKRFADLNN